MASSRKPASARQALKKRHSVVRAKARKRHSVVPAKAGTHVFNKTGPPPSRGRPVEARGGLPQARGRLSQTFPGAQAFLHENPEKRIAVALSGGIDSVV